MVLFMGSDVHSHFNERLLGDPWLDAIDSELLDALEEQLAQGKDIDGIHEYYEMYDPGSSRTILTTGLSYAVKQGRRWSVQWLVSKGASLRIWNDRQCEYGDDVVELDAVSMVQERQRGSWATYLLTNGKQGSLLRFGEDEVGEFDEGDEDDFEGVKSSHLIQLYEKRKSKIVEASKIVPSAVLYHGDSHFIWVYFEIKYFDHNNRWRNRYLEIQESWYHRSEVRHMTLLNFAVHCNLIEMIEYLVEEEGFDVNYEHPYPKQSGPYHQRRRLYCPCPLVQAVLRFEWFDTSNGRYPAGSYRPTYGQPNLETIEKLLQLGANPMCLKNLLVAQREPSKYQPVLDLFVKYDK